MKGFTLTIDSTPIVKFPFRPANNHLALILRDFAPEPVLAEEVEYLRSSGQLIVGENIFNLDREAA